MFLHHTCMCDLNDAPVGMLLEFGLCTLEQGQSWLWLCVLLCHFVPLCAHACCFFAKRLILCSPPLLIPFLACLVFLCLEPAVEEEGKWGVLPHVWFFPHTHTHTHTHTRAQNQ